MGDQGCRPQEKQGTRETEETTKDSEAGEESAGGREMQAFAGAFEPRASVRFCLLLGIQPVLDLLALGRHVNTPFRPRARTETAI